MPVDPAARARLAAEQARLLAALLHDAEPPPGFDQQRLAATAHTLQAKKRRVATQAPPRPLLAKPWWHPIRDALRRLLS